MKENEVKLIVGSLLHDIGKVIVAARVHIKKDEWMAYDSMNSKIEDLLTI